MSLFSHENYRTYLKQYLSKLPKKGHGEASRIAEALGVHSTLVSLILSGERDLTLEQAYDLSLYLQFTELETKYFALLVQYSRAGTHRYKDFIKKSIESVRSEANKVSNRFAHEKTLTEEQRTTFYSSWIYSAVRLFTSTHDKGKNLEEITKRFSMTRQQALKILTFLISAGLVVEEKGFYKMRNQRTFLEHGSPHLLKHHSNWRIKALEQSEQVTEAELMFTSPISVSKEDFGKIREQIAEFLKEFSQTVKDSPAQDIACLNIDFFWIRK